MKKIGPLTILVVAILATTSQAAIISTHTATTTSMLTPFGATIAPFNQPVLTLSFPEFDQSAFPDWILEEVCIEIEGITESELSITAITDSFIESGTIGAALTVGNISAGPSGLTLNAAPNGAVPTTIPLFAGTTTQFPIIVGSDSDSASITGAGISNYIGSGNVTVEVVAFGTSSIDVFGGNIETSQTTEAEAIVTVTYKGTFVPEPSGLAMLPMLGFGLVTAARRRRQ